MRIWFLAKIIKDMGILDKTTNWNIAKNIISVFAVGLITIGVPILAVNLLGIAERGALMGLTWQEFAGIGGFFFLYAPTLFGLWFFGRRKNQKKS